MSSPCTLMVTANPPGRVRTMPLAGQIKSVTADLEDEDEIRVRRDETRDEIQQDVDKDVLRMKTAWEAAGKPLRAVVETKAGFKAADKQAYVVDTKPDLAETKRMIRRAATLHKVGLVWAKDRTITDGDSTSYRVKFTVCDEPQKVHRAAQDGQETPQETPQESPQDQSGDQETPTTGSQPESQRGRFSRR